MRDPKRINRIITKIKKYWEQNPDLRFNQLLIILGAIPDGKHFFIEDDIIEKNINKSVK